MLRQDHPLSWYFHWNSKSYPEPADWAPQDLFASKEMYDRPSIRLSTPPQGIADFAALLTARRSSRTFSGAEITLAQLSAILAQCYGLGASEYVNNVERCRRPVPSAGACYPLEIYVIASKVAGLSAGLYHYRLIDHALECLVEVTISRRRMADLFLDQSFLSDAGAIVVMTAVFDRCMSKYGDRGYRYILLEAGHVGQNIVLSAEGTGLATLPVGGFADQALAALLSLDAEIEAPIYAVAVGHCSDQDNR
jgi:SagB-type dehydrogenase family enzyme